jgi:signal transduction histidine kinase
VARLKRLALALALFAAGAAAAGDDAFWYVQHDNDIFLESDRWYTSGLRLAFTRALDANRRIELGLVQEIYTPEAKRVRFNDVQRDRQYAGRLFVSAARHDSADGFLRTIEATAGVRGPAALAEQSQHGIHRFVPAPETDWSHQLPNQLDAAIGGVHTHELAIPRMAGPQRMAVHYGAVAGNMLTFAHAGFELRTDGARAVPSPALRFAATPPVARERADGWTAFVGASARAVLRNARASAHGRALRGGCHVDTPLGDCDVLGRAGHARIRRTALEPPLRHPHLPPRPLLSVRPRFAFGIRVKLGLAALALLALPWLAAQFIAGMERFLREQQEAHLAATARAIASALSDRPALFERAAVVDPQAEERRRIVGVFLAADPEAAGRLGTAYAPSEEIERLLEIVGRRSSRLMVVDSRSRVRGLAGSLARPDSPAPRLWTSWLRPIAAFVAPPPRVPLGDETKPEQSQIDRALIGVVSTSWRGMRRDPTRAIVSAVQPIFVGDDIVGAVSVEETTDAILILKQRALENLLAMTLAVTAAALAALLFFATRLANRVRALHREAESAIDPQGRITGTIRASQASDEIGDLSRTMAAILERLRTHHAYLEGMGGRLSHELRTPVAVVRSSLDNLKTQSLPADARVYVDRAGEGVERLSRLIARLSEATRLEKMLESAERERFDLARVVSACIDGYRAVNPGRPFALALPAVPVPMQGVPDAFAQLLDKLVENALDFSPPDRPIGVRVEAFGARARIAVENEGPPLPAGMGARLFDSMVSIRDPSAGHDTHLGLGLFIVRLIAEFHGGRVRAQNRESGGVRFEVDVPMAA